MNYEKERRAYISYMKSSCHEYALEVSKSLTGLGYEVFFDKKSPRSDEFEKKLYRTLDNCEWFIIVFAPHIFESWGDEKNWIYRELTYAMEHNKKIIALKTPGLDWEKELPRQLKAADFTKYSDVIELGTDRNDSVVQALRDIIESTDNTGKTEKFINRMYSGIYLWRIAFFPVVAVLMIYGYLTECHGIYLAKANVEIGYYFKYFGTAKVFAFNLIYVIAAALICGLFMYVTKRIIRLDIIPLIIADVVGVTVLSALVRKAVDLMFGLGAVKYWVSPMGSHLWQTSEKTAVYMVVLTIIVRLALRLFKRGMRYT